ncbi:MAG: AAA family ATPase [Thaumarchaeota archaeon]|nr:AAA family ATPase [Candidatus Wolframiiraptor allenii]
MQRRYVILVLGVAGVGKTVFGRALASLLGLKFIDVPELVDRRKLYSGYDVESKAYLVDLRKLSAAAGSELRGGGVLASVYAFKPRGVRVSWAIILRVRPTRLLEILRGRGYPDEKIRENVSAELIDQPLVEAIQKFGRRKIVQLDATDVDLESLARRAAEAIKSRILRQLDRKIDWIGELERSGELEELLRFLERSGF